MEQYFEDIQELLKRCKDKQSTLNWKKMMLGRQTVKFAGYMAGLEGIELDPDKIEALNQFHILSTHHDLKSVMGLINQCGNLSKL